MKYNVYNHPYRDLLPCIHVQICRGDCILESLLCSIIPLVSLLFAVLVSLHPATFLMFFITCLCNFGGEAGACLS